MVENLFCMFFFEYQTRLIIMKGNFCIAKIHNLAHIQLSKIKEGTLLSELDKFIVLSDYNVGM